MLVRTLQQFSLGMRPHESQIMSQLRLRMHGPAMAGPAGPVLAPMMFMAGVSCTNVRYTSLVYICKSCGNACMRIYRNCVNAQIPDKYIVQVSDADAEYIMQHMQAIHTL